MDYNWFIGNEKPWLTIIGSYFFLPFPTASGGPIVLVGWTLNYEMFFYALFATAIFLNRNKAVFATSMAIACLVAFGQSFQLGNTWSHFTNPLMLEFVFGMVIALAYRNGMSLPTWVAIPVCLFGLLIVWKSPSVGAQDLHRAATWGGGFAMAIAGIVLAELEVKARYWAFLILLGDASYALYLTHWYVIVTPPFFLLALHPTQHPIFYSLSAVSISIIVALCIHALDYRVTSAIRGLRTKNRLSTSAIYRP